MITKIRYGAFKSHIDSELPLEPLTIIVGTNASGKTNALEGLSLLSLITTGAELGKTLESSEGNVRGGAASCAPFGEDKLVLGCDFEPPQIRQREDKYRKFDDGDYCSYKISIRMKPVPLVEDERVSFMDKNGKPKYLSLYEVEKFNPEIQVITAKIDNFSRGGVKPRFDFNARIPILFQLLPKLAADQRFKNYKNRPLPYENYETVVNQLTNSLSNISIVDPKPELIRKSGYVPKEVKRMDREGRNLSGVLYNLFQNESIKSQIVDLLRELPEHEISDIGFIETPRNEVQLAITERFGSNLVDVPFEALSDGTIRLLSVLATAFSLKSGGLMVIEEVDTSLHPSKVGRLLELLMQVAKEKNTRLLVTTHNPALLDAVQPKNYNSVIICY